MLISQVIDDIKKLYVGKDSNSLNISDKNTRDKVLFGNANQECTGIVTTCYASVDVIKSAIDKGANLIICHESLFWDRGKDNNSLINNPVYNMKASLLHKGNIVVWRNHDHIHSGVIINNRIVDGIFYGFMKKMNWDIYHCEMFNDHLNYILPDINCRKIAEELISKLNLNGLRIIGDKNTVVKNLRIPLHMLGIDDYDQQVINKIENDEVDALIAMEIVDFTVSNYVRDSTELGISKVIFSIGRFNLEEPGMEYMLEYLPEHIKVNIPCYFERSTDTFSCYISKDKAI